MRKEELDELEELLEDFKNLANKYHKKCMNTGVLYTSIIARSVSNVYYHSESEHIANKLISEAISFGYDDYKSEKENE